MTELTPEQLAEARHEGLTADEYRVMRTVLERDAASRSGLTHEEFRALMRIEGPATLAEWLAATNRDEFGRKKAAQ